LPGNTQAFTSAPIYARTSGYLKRWYVDIGAHVEKGQLLAAIDAPEIDQELQQARADLKTAQAQLELAQITADRW
jgi:multidrug efflux pump subunit AcrA (membrane-fusion protein)